MIHCYMANTKELTPKMYRFCRELASGKTQAEAYRIAYNVGDEAKPSTQREAASRLMARSNIRATVEELIAKREAGIQARSLSQRDLVLTRLREAIDNEDFGSNRLKALDLMATVAGMKRTDVNITQNDDRDAETIKEELAAKLMALGIGLDTGSKDDSDAVEAEHEADEAEPDQDPVPDPVADPSLH